MDSAFLAQVESRARQFAKAVGRDNLELILGAAQRQTLAAGAPVIEEGRPVDALYLILDGTVSVVIQSGERRLTLGRLGAGQFFGEVSLLSGDTAASATVIADTEVQLVRVGRDDFERLLETHPSLASVWLHELTATLAQRLRAAADILRSTGAGLASAGADRPQADSARHASLVDVFRSLLGLRA